MANLASTYWNQGRWKEAEELNIGVMKIRKRVLGEEHPHTLIIMANLASTYWNQGRWKEAEELEIRVMETNKRVLKVDRVGEISSRILRIVLDGNECRIAYQFYSPLNIGIASETGIVSLSPRREVNPEGTVKHRNSANE
jgi:hypothetical protein